MPYIVNSRRVDPPEPSDYSTVPARIIDIEAALLDLNTGLRGLEPTASGDSAQDGDAEERR